MTVEDVKELGFEDLPYPNIGRSLLYDLGRERHLSVSSVGTPNEMLWLCQADDKNPTQITDLICIRNFDYDGLMTKEELKSIIEALKSKK